VAGLVVILLGLAVGPALTRFDAMDQSGDAWGRQILEGAFEAVEEDAVIISWWSFSTPLWYGQHVEGRRPDVTIIDDRDILDDGYGDVGSAVEAHLGERPVYVIRLERDVTDLRRDYLLTPVPDVPMEMYRVVPEGTD
jgi:hypothetical protein